MHEPPPSAVFVSGQYARFDYGAAPPMRIGRLPLTVEVAAAYGLLDGPGIRVLPATIAPDEDLRRFHRPEYLAALQRASAGEAGWGLLRWGLGSWDNPTFPNLYEYSALLTGATLSAGRLVEAGEVRVAFNIAGGLHHAAPDRASGFCYVNDAAVLIAELLARGRRIAYVDIDAHHGDGVQFGFYDTDRVLTISLHETGETLFPGTGFPEETGTGAGEGFSVNVPLAPGTDDEIFLWALEAVVPPLLRAYAPDLLVTQLGIDTHRTDPLAHLTLTIQGFRRAVEVLRGCDLPWVALGGGGYDGPGDPGPAPGCRPARPPGERHPARDPERPAPPARPPRAGGGLAVRPGERGPGPGSHLPAVRPDGRRGGPGPGGAYGIRPGPRDPEVSPVLAEQPWASRPGAGAEETRMPFQDKTLTCMDCGQEFVFTAGEQEFFAQKGFTNEPKRCKACKSLRRGASGNPAREEHEVTCSQCGQRTTVPFRPVLDKP
ncbi:MAG: zinc-ribbon domain containing protein, partial [candidate division NC10 bacterium]|nr:zinc-ribbon domain containing protein [candidate division NC10 bacterium]